MNEKSQFIKNLFAAFLAQGISLLVSVFMSFIIPKILGVTQYSYWQLFIFYSGYVGFFHFGFNDGLYLRLGGKKFEELDHDNIGTEFKLFFFIQYFISLTLIYMSNVYISNPEMDFI